MNDFWDGREHTRLSIDGEAFWSAGRIEGSCRLRNLSLGGVEIADPQPPLEVGSRLYVTLFIDQLRLESVAVEVVRSSETGLGLRFRAPGAQFTSQIEALIAERTKPRDGTGD